MSEACSVHEDKVIADVKQWLRDVVIGLNLCPFASYPTQKNQVRFAVTAATDDDEVLACLEQEMQRLDAVPASEIETTLVIVPAHLQDFFDYNQCLQWAQRTLKRNGWVGVYQLASFHPDYCFWGAEPEDLENLTNRAPYPIIHIIREESLARALAFVEDPEAIPETNKNTVNALSEKQQRELFPWLFRAAHE